MNVGTTQNGVPLNLECECIPPLDMPETWGVAWDRQIAAADAWQLAWTEIEARSVRVSAGGNVHQFVERRKQAVMIDFPDRRRAA